MVLRGEFESPVIWALYYILQPDEPTRLPFPKLTMIVIVVIISVMIIVTRRGFEPLVSAS